MWNKARLAAIGAYLLCACGLGFHRPGLHYDEAIFFNGAVHIVNSDKEPHFAVTPHSWVTISSRKWPVMVLPYVGPMRTYAAVAPFALFGISATTCRIVTTLLGALGIWGFSILIRDQFGAPVAAVTAWILAIHPTYLPSTIYDRGGVTEWMAPAALVSIALARYLRSPGAGRLFWLGAAVGFAAWTRANFVWLVIAALLAAAAVLRKRLLVPWRQFAAFCAGGLLGAAPLLWYEIASSGGTFEFMRAVQSPRPPLKLLFDRTRMLSWTLLSGSEHREMWAGPDMPLWQMLLFPALVALALFLCLRRDKPPANRILALTFLGLLFFLFVSRLYVSEHHLIALVPLAAALVAVAGQEIWWWGRPARFLVGLAAVVYIGCAADWNLLAARSIRSTGGVEGWSDTVNQLVAYLGTESPGHHVKLVDWGLHNSLFVLSGGTLLGSEIYPGATPERSGSGKTWAEEVAQGDIYVIHSNNFTYDFSAAESFERALATLPVKFRRIQWRQRNGRPWVETIEIVRTVNNLPASLTEDQK